MNFRTPLKPGRGAIGAGIFLLAAFCCSSPSCGRSPFDDSCVYSIDPGYRIRGTLVGEDECPFAETPIRLQGLAAADDEPAITDRELQTTGGGEFVVSWTTVHADFVRTGCITEEDLLERFELEPAIPRIVIIELSFEVNGQPETITIPVGDDLLPDYKPYDFNILEMGQIVATGIFACDE